MLNYVRFGNLNLNSRKTLKCLHKRNSASPAWKLTHHCDRVCYENGIIGKRGLFFYTRWLISFTVLNAPFVFTQTSTLCFRRFAFVSTIFTFLCFKYDVYKQENSRQALVLSIKFKGAVSNLNVTSGSG